MKREFVNTRSMIVLCIPVTVLNCINRIFKYTNYGKILIPYGKILIPNVCQQLIF